MSKLLFLSNELMNPSVHRDLLRIPLRFVQFAHIEGKMFKHFRSEKTFVSQDANRQFGNKVVYGAIFVLDDFDFYIGLLDAYHGCSLTTLYRNHDNDLHHRINVMATPIYFSTLDELSRLKYREGEQIGVQTYVGNLKHPKILQRTNHKKVSYRIISGVDKAHFTSLFREVSNEE